MIGLIDVLEFNIFEDTVRAVDTKPSFVYSRKEFWNGFCIFLQQFEPQVFEDGVVVKFPRLVDIIIIILHLNNTVWRFFKCFFLIGCEILCLII